MNTQRLVGALASAAVFAGGLAAAPTASAAPLTRTVNTVTDFSCAFETREGAVVFFFGSASSIDGDSGSALLVENSEGVTVLEGQGGTATFGEGSIGADVEVVDPRGAEPVPVGVASVTATRTVTGGPVTEEISDRSGNSWTTGTLTVTDYRVAVTSVSVPGYTIVPGADDCRSQEIAFDVKSTNPTAQIYSQSSLESAICTLQGLPNGEVRLSGEPLDPTFEVVVDDGANPLKAEGTLRLPGGSGQATAPLVEVLSDRVVADLSIDVDLVKIGTRQQDTETFGGITVRATWVPYRAIITVTTSDGRSGSADCYAEHVTEKIIVRPNANDGEA